MGRAKIIDGIWIRNVPVTWQHNGVGRSDIFKSVLADPRLKVAEYRFAGGPTVRIPKQELQRIIEGGMDHYSDKIWGPFNIAPCSHTVNDQQVEMEFVSP